MNGIHFITRGETDKDRKLLIEATDGHIVISCESSDYSPKNEDINLTLGFPKEAISICKKPHNLKCTGEIYRENDEWFYSVRSRKDIVFKLEVVWDISKQGINAKYPSLKELFNRDTKETKHGEVCASGRMLGRLSKIAKCLERSQLREDKFNGGTLKIEGNRAFMRTEFSKREDIHLAFAGIRE